MDDQYRITTTQQLEDTIGTPMEYVRVKIQPRLEVIMQEFIGRAPLLFVATLTAGGEIDISPKGDPAGFVQVDGEGNLLIPERPGNQLAFGFRNILDNGQIGLMFIVPHQRETLRVKGVATLHRDPAVLQQMQVNGAPALMYTKVTVTECYFHCGKALIRSRLWKPESWSTDTASLGARQFASLGAVSKNPDPEEAVRETECRLEQAYQHSLY